MQIARIFTFFGLLCLFVGGLCLPAPLQAQELLARVEILSPQVQNTNKRALDVLQKMMQDFLNNRAWTQRKADPQERIDCTFVVTITSWDGSSQYKANAQNFSSRPVFNSAYQSPLLSRVDPHFDFSYVEGQALEYSDQQFSNNLTSLLAFYAYLITGIDADTFAPNGGSSAYQAAQAVLQNSTYAGFEGWGSMDGTNSRYWLVQNVLDARYQPMRDFWYLFSREVLDPMHDQPNRARERGKSLLALLKPIDRMAQGALLHTVFFTAKANEFVGVFSGLSLQDRLEISQWLVEMDPAHANQYETLKNVR